MCVLFMLYIITCDHFCCLSLVLAMMRILFVFLVGPLKPKKNSTVVSSYHRWLGGRNNMCSQARRNCSSSAPEAKKAHHVGCWRRRQRVHGQEKIEKWVSLHCTVLLASSLLLTSARVCKVAASSTNSENLGSVRQKAKVHRIALPRTRTANHPTTAMTMVGRVFPEGREIKC